MNEPGETKDFSLVSHHVALRVQPTDRCAPRNDTPLPRLIGGDVTAAEVDLINREMMDGRSGGSFIVFGHTTQAQLCQYTLSRQSRPLFNEDGSIYDIDIGIIGLLHIYGKEFARRG